MTSKLCPPRAPTWYRFTPSLAFLTMPTRLDEVLTQADAEAWIAGTCFRTGPVGRLGLELEFLVGSGDSCDLSRHYPRGRYPALLEALSEVGAEGRVDAEPGGQIE